MKHILKNIFVSIILLSITLSALANEVAEDYLDIAQNYAQAGKLSKALEYADYALKIDPNFKSAIDFKEKLAPKENVVIDSLPKSDRVNNSEYLNQNLTKNIQTGILNKNSFEYNFNQGKIYYSQKDYKNALTSFKKAMELDKNSSITFNNIGMCYLQLNDVESAKKYLLKSNKLNKTYTDGLVNLSLIYKNEGDYNLMLKTLKKALTYNSDDFYAYYILGDYYRSQGAIKLAIDNFSNSIKANDKFDKAYLAIALSYFDIEEYNLSNKALAYYLAINPDSDFGNYLMARNYELLGQYFDAQIKINKAIKLNNINLYQEEFGKIKYATDDFQGALLIFENLFDKKASTYNYIGLCHYKMKNIDTAIINFNKAISQDSKRPIYYYNLAQCYKTKNDNLSYSKYLKSATILKPQNAQDYIDLSSIYMDNTNKTYAINTLNSGIEKFPNVKSLYLAKLKIYELCNDNSNYTYTKREIENKFNEKSF